LGTTLFAAENAPLHGATSLVNFAWVVSHSRHAKSYSAKKTWVNIGQPQIVRNNTTNRTRWERRREREQRMGLVLGGRPRNRRLRNR
jgi:hypothetical protein